MAALQSGLPIARTGRLYAEAGGRLPYWLYAAACCGSDTFRRLPEAAGVARKTSTIGWPQDAAWTPCGWVGRDASRPTSGFSPEGLLPRSAPVRYRWCPIRGELVPMATTCHRMPFGWLVVTGHDPCPRKPVKLERCGMRPAFCQERNPVKTSWMRDAVGVFSALPESIHQTARKDNLRRLAPGLRRRGAPGAGKVRVHAWRRRRATPGSRGLPARRAGLFAWPWTPRPAFRLVGREDL